MNSAATRTCSNVDCRDWCSQNERPALARGELYVRYVLVHSQRGRWQILQVKMQR